MRCAKLPENRIEFLNDFCDEFSQALEEYKESRETDGDKDKFIAKMKEFGNIPHAINHLLTCYDTLLTNACDPALDYLEFTPEIKAFMDSKKEKVVDGAEQL